MRAANATPARVSPFLLFLSLIAHPSFPRSRYPRRWRWCRRWLFCFHGATVPRLRIIDYRRAQWSIPRATWSRASRNGEARFRKGYSIEYYSVTKRPHFRTSGKNAPSFFSLVNIASLYPYGGLHPSHDFFRYEEGKVLMQGGGDTWMVFNDRKISRHYICQNVLQNLTLKLYLNQYILIVRYRIC